MNQNRSTNKNNIPKRKKIFTNLPTINLDDLARKKNLKSSKPQPMNQNRKTNKNKIITPQNCLIPHPTISQNIKIYTAIVPYSSIYQSIRVCMSTIYPKLNYTNGPKYFLFNCKTMQPKIQSFPKFPAFSSKYESTPINNFQT